MQLPNQYIAIGEAGSDMTVLLRALELARQFKLRPVYFGAPRAESSELLSSENALEVSGLISGCDSEGGFIRWQESQGVAVTEQVFDDFPEQRFIVSGNGQSPSLKLQESESVEVVSSTRLKASPEWYLHGTQQLVELGPAEHSVAYFDFEAKPRVRFIFF